MATYSSIQLFNSSLVVLLLVVDLGPVDLELGNFLRLFTLSGYSIAHSPLNILMGLFVIFELGVAVGHQPDSLDIAFVVLMHFAVGD